MSQTQDCEVWRTNVVREIVKKVSDIQNGSLAEFKIRELNDSINELINEKRAWESRILELGGRDYKAEAFEKFGDDVYGGQADSQFSEDYLYFGAAK